MARLEADGEFAEQLFVHGLGVQTAEGLAEWLHAKIRDDYGIARHAGPALLVGLPGGAGPVPARARRGAARPPADRDEHLPRLRARAGAVDAGDRRPPSRRDLLRHEVGHAAEQRPPAGRRCDRRQRPRSDAPVATCRTRIRTMSKRPRQSRPTPRSGPRTGVIAADVRATVSRLMMRGRSLALAVPAALALALPASAGAACAQTSIDELAARGARRRDGARAAGPDRPERHRPAVTGELPRRGLRPGRRPVGHQGPDGADERRGRALRRLRRRQPDGRADLAAVGHARRGRRPADERLPRLVAGGWSADADDHGRQALDVAARCIARGRRAPRGTADGDRSARREGRAPRPGARGGRVRLPGAGEVARRRAPDARDDDHHRRCSLVDE